jgi:hypothetical protein
MPHPSHPACSGLQAIFGDEYRRGFWCFVPSVRQEAQQSVLPYFLKLAVHSAFFAAYCYSVSSSLPTNCHNTRRRVLRTIVSTSNSATVQTKHDVAVFVHSSVIHGRHCASTLEANNRQSPRLVELRFTHADIRRIKPAAQLSCRPRRAPRGPLIGHFDSLPPPQPSRPPLWRARRGGAETNRYIVIGRFAQTISIHHQQLWTDCMDTVDCCCYSAVTDLLKLCEVQIFGSDSSN